MTIEETFMFRCLQIARLGAGLVAPNPMVGAVLVYQGRIIAEGYHARFGGPHAEVQCIAGVSDECKHLISQSTLYVSLEPCSHFGKTPPCTDLIIEKKIPKVVIGCLDPFQAVNGKGIEKLIAAGVEVTIPVLEYNCVQLNKRFFCFDIKKRPYIILKWARSMDGYMAAGNHAPIHISNSLTNHLVHKWRATEASILIGYQTAMSDDPELSVRLWKGANPLRLVIDPRLNLPCHLKIFDKKSATIVFNTLLEDDQQDHLRYWKIGEQAMIDEIMLRLYQHGIQSVLVEGGPKTLQAFIDARVWDEARVITNRQLLLHTGVSSPRLQDAQLNEVHDLLSDEIATYTFNG